MYDSHRSPNQVSLWGSPGAICRSRGYMMFHMPTCQASCPSSACAGRSCIGCQAPEKEFTSSVPTQRLISAFGSVDHIDTGSRVAGYHGSLPDETNLTTKVRLYVGDTVFRAVRGPLNQRLNLGTNMGLLTSTSPAPPLFQQSKALSRTASLSESELVRSAGGPSRGSANGQTTSQRIARLEKGLVLLQGGSGLGNGLVNGDAEHVASSETNDKSFKPQNVLRTRTENHQTLTHRPKPSMIRSKTNYESKNISSSTETTVEEHGELRHGWEDEYNSSEFLGQLNSVCAFKYPLSTLHNSR